MINDSFLGSGYSATALSEKKDFQMIDDILQTKFVAQLCEIEQFAMIESEIIFAK